MRTEWDYTDLADAYLKRPDYCAQAIDQLLSKAGVKKGARVCDVGAGVAHLTIPLAERGMVVSAVEPNDAMRGNGIERTKKMKNVTWFEGTGEKTGQPDKAFDLVTFGSSFNVTDRAAALRETARILKPRGWFACMWNHRGLDDPVQQRIESIIKAALPDYSYGARREDQEEVIKKSGLFGEVSRIEGPVEHSQGIEDCVEAWRSHATLQRQAGERFRGIVDAIEKMLRAEVKGGTLKIPYTTRIWCAQLR